MPRFNEQEKVRIREKLLKEGEKLFASVGLRKITIDNLTEAAGISHSSFYVFFQNKEHLFMEILIKNKKVIYEELDALLKENNDLPPKQLAKFYILSLREKFFSDPIIISLDGSLKEYISRKVSSKLIPKNDLLDQESIDKLIRTGIKMRYSRRYTVKLSEAVFIGISSFDGDKDKDILTEILVDSLIEKLGCF